MKKLIAAILAVGCAASAGAQSTPYYILDGDGHFGYIIKNGAIQSTFNIAGTPAGPEYALRFDQSNLLIANLDGSQSQGYSLTGTKTGVVNPLAQSLYQFLDGGTDGTYTYTARCCSRTNDGVYRGDMDFGNQTLLASRLDVDGVTYGNGSIWALSMGDLLQYSMAGMLLNTYALNLAGRSSALAYESSTNSLWFGVNQRSDIYNYSLAGQQLDHLVINGLGGNYFGGEMLNASSVVPEPSTYALMSAGLLALAGAAHRRKKKQIRQANPGGKEARKRKVSVDTQHLAGYGSRLT